MKLYFVRHAEPDYESEKYGNGLFPGPPLTEQGIQQAKELATKFKNMNFDMVFCSDYVRTKQTIKPALPLNIRYDSRLREVADVLNGYMTYNNFTEPEESQKSRLNSFCDEISKSPFNSILIVAHFNTIEYISRKLGKHIKQPKYAEIHCVKVRV